MMPCHSCLFMGFGGQQGEAGKVLESLYGVGASRKGGWSAKYLWG